MKNVCTCGESNFVIRNVERFDATGWLKSPFRMVLIDAVLEEYCISCGKVRSVQLPNTQTMIAFASVLRASFDLKLNGDEIRFLRKSLNRTQKQLAEDFDYSHETISRYETGALPAHPSFDKQLRMAVYLGHISLTNQLALSKSLGVVPEDVMSMNVRNVRNHDEDICFELRYPLEFENGGPEFVNQHQASALWTAERLSKAH